MVKKILLILFLTINIYGYEIVEKAYPILKGNIYYVKTIDKDPRYYSTVAKKYLESEDILRSKPEYILHHLHKDIDIQYLKNVNFKKFKIDNKYIYFGNNYELKVNILENKELFKPFTGFPSLYNGPKYDVEKKQVFKNKKKIALTFDDGPNEYHQKMRDLFDKYNQKATFCVVGTMLKNKEHQEMLLKTYQNGHEIINHTMNHKVLPKLSDDEIFEEIISVRNKVLEITGYDPVFLRPPYGEYDARVRKMVDKIVLWNVDSLDWKTRNKDIIISQVKNDLNKNRTQIVLMHDIHKETYEAMLELLPYLIDQGYELVTYSQLTSK